MAEEEEKKIKRTSARISRARASKIEENVRLRKSETRTRRCTREARGRVQRLRTAQSPAPDVQCRDMRFVLSSRLGFVSSLRFGRSIVPTTRARVLRLSSTLSIATTPVCTHSQKPTRILNGTFNGRRQVASTRRAPRDLPPTYSAAMCISFSPRNSRGIGSSIRCGRGRELERARDGSREASQKTLSIVLARTLSLHPLSKDRRNFQRTLNETRFCLRVRGQSLRGGLPPTEWKEFRNLKVRCRVVWDEWSARSLERSSARARPRLASEPLIHRLFPKERRLRKRDRDVAFFEQK